MYCKVPTLLVGALTTLMLPRISNAYSKGDMVSREQFLECIPLLQLFSVITVPIYLTNVTGIMIL